MAEVEAALGPVEVLVNNAGITRDAPFHRMTPQQWQEVIDTNLSGLFNMTHNVWNGMRDRKFGRVISISSINGQKGQFAQANYAAAKAGDIGFTKALAQEGARAGITVNVIAPGYINTEMMAGIKPEVMKDVILPAIPVGRLGEPEEIARCVVFLASDGQLLRFGAASVRPQGRAAAGMAGIRLSPGATVAFFGAVDPRADAVVVTSAGSSDALPGTQPGSLKVTPYAEYPVKGRGTGGVRAHRFLRGEDALVLAWVGATPARASGPGGVALDLPEATGRRGGIHNSVTRLLVKPSHLIGGYAQLAYAFNYLGPTGNQRDMVATVRRRSQEVQY